MVTWALLLLLAATVAVVGAGVVLLSLFTHPAGGDGLAANGALMVLTGLGAASTLLPAVRSGLARLIPISPSSLVHSTALVLSIVLFGTQLSARVTLSGAAAQAASLASPLGPFDLIAQELPFLLLAVLGTGYWIRRDLSATVSRLGWARPRSGQILLALAAAGAFYAFSAGADLLGQRLTPANAEQVQAATQHIFGRLDNPIGIATIALAAGICEEALFRGALQPRLGLIWTALVFAAVHTQYGISFDALAVLVLAFCLGLLRRYANTTTSTICHVAYNALAGIGVAGPWLAPALAVEAGLLIAALTMWRLQHRPRRPEPARIEAVDGGDGSKLGRPS